MTAEDIIAHQDLVRRIPVPDHIYTEVARLVRKTRPARRHRAGIGCCRWCRGVRGHERFRI